MTGRPNIVLVIVHDLGQHLGCYGVTTVRSPNCDALAADGIRFSNIFCTAPQCSPSRAALFTGRYPHQNGMLGLAHDPHGWDLNPGEVHLAAHLRRGGYHTALVGFQHETRRPDQMGYDTCDYRWHDSCENIGRDAAEHIQRHGNGQRPYYLQVGMIEPHRRFEMYGGVPDDTRGVWVPPYLEDEPSARTDLAAYQGAIRKMDASLGVILGAVEDSASAENTLVLFTTDHGIPFPRAKCSLYDPGLQVALIARWPAGGWVGGNVVDGLVSTIDVTPTLLDIAGVDAPRTMAGVSLFGNSSVGIAPRRELVFGEMTYHDYYDPMRCVRDSDYKLIANFSTSPYVQDPSQAWRPLTTPLPSGITSCSHPDFELYDLGTDPYEMANIFDTAPVATHQRRLLDVMATWCTETGDALVTERPLNPQHRRVRDRILSASR